VRPHINVVTLAVDDLGAALAFYREGLGLESPGIIGTEFEGDDPNLPEPSRCSSSTED
jgi:hypothetical protein